MDPPIARLRTNSVSMRSFEWARAISPLPRWSTRTRTPAQRDHPNSRREMSEASAGDQSVCGRIVNRDVEAGTQSEVRLADALTPRWGGTFATQHH
jgi:hypothetical protein